MAALVGVAFGLTTDNVNLLTVGFTCLLYAILSLGLNIAAGWSGLLDLGYIAFVGFGAYGYAIFSSTALGSGGTGGAHLAAFESIPIVMIAGGLVGVADRPGRAAAGGRLPGDRDAVRRTGVRRDRQQRRPGNARRRQRHLLDLDSLHGLSGNVSTARGYYFVALIVVVVCLASCTCSTPREPAARGARCATTRWPRPR